MAQPYVISLKNPEDTPVKIAGKLNTLKSVIDASVIKGIVTKEEFDTHTKIVSRYISGNKERIDTNDLRWHGGGLSKVSHDSSLSGNGTPASPLSVLSSGNFVDNEVVTGVTNTFTLAHTPILGSEHLFGLGQRLTPSVDYSISGAVITTVNPWSAGQILGDYRY